MKISRLKKVNRYLNYYANNFGFRKPFQILIDGTFCYGALKNKLNIQEQLPKYLGEVKLLTTPCVIMETESLGKEGFGAMMIVKQFSVHRCSHTSKPVSGSECFQSMLGDSNSSRYVVATQDRDLQEIIRHIPGTPLLYLHQKTPHLEEPSSTSVQVAAQKAHSRFNVSKQDDLKLTTLKSDVFGNEKDIKSKKRKFKGGPNPLSCKRKKKQMVDINKKPETVHKKHRKRIRVKYAKHVKEVLINNGS